MKIWTVSAIDNEERYGIVQHICGSYATRGLALDECVKWMLDRFDTLPCLAYAMANDEEHHGFRLDGLFSERKDGKTVIARGCRHKLEEFLRDELGGQGCYRIYDGKNEYMFQVDENDVEGTIWQTVTWGDSDCEDPDFTTPWPEMFTSEETAVKTFIDYVKDLFRQHGMRFTAKCEAYIRKQVDEDGKVQVDLNDGCCVCLVLNHDDAVNVK